MTIPDPIHVPATLLHTPSGDSAWWRNAVIYQIYPRSFADGNGDGMGDLPGIISRLPYLRDLGVDAVWLSPFYTSPQADAGYDVADYRDVDPLFGSLADAEQLVTAAHDLGLKVIVDLVPNHTSDQHEWFRKALAAAPGSTERARYLFRDGRGPHGDEPPNDWESVFGGPAWTRTTDGDGTPGQWYLHLFDERQPDLNWRDDQVRAEFEAILAFWLDRGVDGMRVDVAHGLIKAEGLPDWQGPMNMLELTGDHTAPPMWDQDEVHDIYRSWRKVLDSYNPTDRPGHDGAHDRAMCAEAWVTPPQRAALYVRPDEFHQAFNFDFLYAEWTAEALRLAIDRSYAANDAVGAPTTWVLSNHDVVRHATRLGLPAGTRWQDGIGPGDPQPDTALGLRRARAATMLMLALPGAAYLYQGEELGLPEHTTLPDEVRQDPTWARSGHTVRGRDGCRVPLPWDSGAAHLGFGDGEDPWLPQPGSFTDLAVDRQDRVDGSTLELYRTLLRRRRERGLGRGAVSWLDAPSDVLALRNDAGETSTTILVNLGRETAAIPDQAMILAASGPLDGGLPADTAVWMTTPTA